MCFVFTTDAKIGFFGEYIYLCQDINLYKVRKTSILLLVSVLTFLLMSLSGCGRYEQIRVVSGKVESLNINGFKTVDIVLSLRVDNPAGKVVLQDVHGSLKHFGKVLGRVTLTPLALHARTVADYRVEACVTLESGIGIRDIMGLMDVRKLQECAFDLSVTGKASGVKIKKEYKDIPLKKLLEERHNDKV